MSHSQFHSINSFIQTFAWLNLWDKRMLLAESTRLLFEINFRFQLSLDWCLQLQYKILLYSHTNIFYSTSGRGSALVLLSAFNFELLVISLQATNFSALVPVGNNFTWHLIPMNVSPTYGFSPIESSKLYQRISTQPYHSLLSCECKHEQLESQLFWRMSQLKLKKKLSRHF
jgi:hypothetical protein